MPEVSRTPPPSPVAAVAGPPAGKLPAKAPAKPGSKGNLKR